MKCACIIVMDIEELFVVPKFLRSLIFGMSNNIQEQNNCNSNQDGIVSVVSRILDLDNFV